jgi:hypothetical protein
MVSWTFTSLIAVINELNCRVSDRPMPLLSGIGVLMTNVWLSIDAARAANGDNARIVGRMSGFMVEYFYDQEAEVNNRR